MSHRDISSIEVENGKHKSEWNKYKTSRISRKLSVVDESRLLSSMSQDLPERSWSEIFSKEDADMVVLEVREQLLQGALAQPAPARPPPAARARLAARCAATAALQVIDWYFYRHDPGEEGSWPAVSVPRRAASWLAEAPPAPAPPDACARQPLPVRPPAAPAPPPPPRAGPSADSMHYPDVQDIPRECWFPGKIKWPKSEGESYVIYGDSRSGFSDSSGDWLRDASGSALAPSSELLQRVTDYTDPSLPVSPRPSPRVPSAALIEGEAWSARPCETAPPAPAPPAPPAVPRPPPPPPPAKTNLSVRSVRSVRAPRAAPPPPPAPARLSHCRLRPLRLETQYEVNSEKIESKPAKADKKKKK
ncbi:vegetative cell wall protein gp1-like [Plutella xylostella]|uniref:vegetative cell wall protein gp1-like n=1 Tax=Plutella xylostella TaxID=51655 RepID=UPI002032244D|nr:vegetative cell wall protein gp1-like [Plutella xylostella]